MNDTLQVSFADALQVSVKGELSDACIAALDAAMPEAVVHIRQPRMDGMVLIAGAREYLFAPVDLRAQQVGPFKYGFSAGFVGRDCVYLEIQCGAFRGELPGDWASAWPRGNPMARGRSGLPALGMPVAELHARLEPIIDKHQTYRPPPPPKRVPTAVERFIAGERKTITFGEGSDALFSNGYDAVGIRADGTVPPRWPNQSSSAGGLMYDREHGELPAAIHLAGLCVVTVTGSPELVAVADAILAAGDDMADRWGRRASLAMVDKRGVRSRLFAGAWLPEQFENETDARLRSFAPSEWTQLCTAGDARIELGVRTGRRQLLKLQNYSWPAGSPFDTDGATRLRYLPSRAELVGELEAEMAHRIALTAA